MSSALDGQLLIVAAFAYLLASMAYGAHLFLRTKMLVRYARLVAILGVAAHTFSIGVHCAHTHATPFQTPAETLSASAWAIAMAYLLLDFVLKQKPTALGAFALPAAFLCVFGGAVFEQGRRGVFGGATTHMLDSGVISLHVIALLFAFGLLVLAFGTAILYLIQHRMLKRKTFAGLFGKLPPLSSLEHQAFTLVAFAFPLLTVGLISGILTAAAGGLPGAWTLDPKILASTVTWFVYMAYLFLHAAPAWRGPRANYLLIGGMAAALLTYFIPTTAHRFG
jgi:HemX protein